MPKKKVSLDVTKPDNFTYDMSRCIKCKGCYWVDHIYMPGIKFSTKCPSATHYLFDAYGAYGKLRIGLGLMEGRLDYSDELLKILYACPLCGACDVGCKRNLDLEIELTLEALRVKAVKDGHGPPPAHRRIADNITRSHNRFGVQHTGRHQWLPSDITPAAKAELLYFVGCSATYMHTEIARSTAQVLSSSGTEFMLMSDEWCCGNVPFSVGMIDQAKELAKHNIEAIKQAGATTVLTSCAECYRTLKVDYPKMLNISTADLGFKVVHLVELVDELVKTGNLKLSNRLDLRLAYHDSCSLSRLSEPWLEWQGERGLWGVVDPPVERRRGSNGVYQPPRDILNAIPGVELLETPRKRENNWCCGAGRGTKEVFPEFARWAAEKKFEEVKEVSAEAIVSACPWCKENFVISARLTGNEIKIFDISELIAAAISR
ncbi:MAG: (Fe-S)-binding protein [Chloroflexi bacterium]|nr:(Fe-S)-binding protein [Chloroflexota bacterium]